MILSFADDDTQSVFDDIACPSLPPSILHAARRKLIQIHVSQNLNDLRIPSDNQLEALKGSLRGKHSIRINRQWRICFRWEGSDAYEVEIVDYH